MPDTSSFTLAEAVTHVRDDLGASGTKFYTDAFIKRHLKAAYKKFCADLKFHYTSGSANSVIGTGEYDAPAAIFEITDIEYNSELLSKTSVEFLSRRNRKWRSDSNGTPKWYYLLRGMSYGLYPKPDAVKTIKAYGYGVPTYPASDATAYTLPDEFEDLLLTLACAYCSRRDIHGEGERQYALFMAEYNRRLDEAVRSIEGTEDTVVGGDRRSAGLARVGRPFTSMDWGGTIG